MSSERCGAIALACFRFLSSWHPTEPRFQHLLLLRLLSLERPTPMLQVDPWIFFVFSDCHATEWEFPHYVHARDIFVFSSYVTLIPLQCVPFISHQDMESVALALQMSLRVLPSSLHLPAKLAFVTCQASFCHFPLGLKFASPASCW